MTDFPTIQKPKYNGLEGRVIKKQVRNETEANYVISRRRSLRSRGAWNLQWDSLPEIDYQTLITFFEANQGSNFNWIHPVTSVVYDVRFIGDEITDNIPHFEGRSCQVSIDEV